DFEYLLVNVELANQFQLEPAAMIGRRLSVHSPDTLQNGLFEKYVEVVDTGQTLDIEFSPGNSARYFRISGVKLDDGLVVTYHDIPERKQDKTAMIQTPTMMSSIR